MQKPVKEQTTCCQFLLQDEQQVYAIIKNIKTRNTWCSVSGGCGRHACDWTLLSFPSQKASGHLTFGNLWCYTDFSRDLVQLRACVWAFSRTDPLQSWYCGRLGRACIVQNVSDAKWCSSYIKLHLISKPSYFCTSALVTKRKIKIKIKNLSFSTGL